MKISTRLGAGFGLLIFLLLLCAGVALHALLQARENIDTTVSKKIYRLNLIQEMRNNSRDMSVAVRNIALLSDIKEKKAELELIFIHNTQYYANRENLVKSMSKNVSPEGRNALNDLLRVDDSTIKLVLLAGKNAMEKPQAETINYLMKTVQPQQHKMLGALNILSDVQEKVTIKSVSDARELVSHTVIMMAVLVLFSFFIAIAVCITSIRTLMRQLGGEPAEAQTLAAAIAAGDLTTLVSLRQNDTTSLLASLRGMQANLRVLVLQIKDTSASVALAADEIAQGNTELSSRTEEQATALQETAASMEQLTATVKSNTAGARATAESARDTVLIAQEGGSEVQRMSITMQNISVSATKVRDITSVIESIAFQTNILALNAAVEAARAGKEGRGFAVVAAEVRTLAQRSATAAKDVKALIEEAVEQVESGVTVAASTGQSILKIVGMVGELAEAMDNISLVSSEQMQGISQVSVAVSQVDGVTQNNAALVEESLSASQSLSEQARALRGMVEMFSV